MKLKSNNIDINKYVEEYVLEQEANARTVASPEYIDWIYNYVSIHGTVDDESALYIYQGIDKEYGNLLCEFLDYVEGMAEQQGVHVISEEDCMFANEVVIIKIKDKYFHCFRMYGQGTLVAIELLKSKPDCEYVEI